MKLILQAIKALFRKVENAISHNVAKLQKQIDSVKSTATMAKTMAGKAQTVAGDAQYTAETAQTTADSAKAAAETAQTKANSAYVTASQVDREATRSYDFSGTNIKVDEASTLEVGQSCLMQKTGKLINVSGILSPGGLYRIKIGFGNASRYPVLIATGGYDATGIMTDAASANITTETTKTFSIYIKNLESTSTIVVTRLA